MAGRVNVSIADVRSVAVPVLRHRIFTNFRADAEGVSPVKLVEQLVKAVPEPKIKQEEQLEAEARAEVQQMVAAAAEDQPERMIVKCTKCGRTLSVSRQARGRKARCHGCGEVFSVES
jgi:ribosomal protein S27E